jgi:MFS transporter, DHA2 family, multidrug resistance protein
MESKPLIGGERTLVTVALALATFMQVLDTSIANVAIPAISGDLGVSPTQGTWVITSFAVSNAIAVPLTGWLARRFGEVRLFAGAILLFTIASWACGLSNSIGMLIFFRVVQGAVAGPMIPLSQSLLLAIYPPEKKGTALALWSMTTLVAPICGPIFGGWITDNISWPWIFYINVPVGLLCAYIAWERLRSRETQTVKLPIDGIGLALLVTGVGCLQVMLDKGKELDWFHNSVIVTLAIVSVIALIALVIWELTEEHPIIDLQLFARRNFTAGAISISLGYMVFFGSVVILPLWLQTQLNYTSTWAGLATAPTGILAIVFSPWVGKNLTRIDGRYMATFSFAIFALCSFWRASYNTDASFEYIAMPQLVQGIAMAFFFVPLVSITLSGLPPDRIASASGLSNFLRILAGSFGASLSTTLWDRRAAVHHAQLTEHISAYNPIANQSLDQLQSLGISAEAAYVSIERTITNQAYMLSTIDVFWLAGWIFVALIPLVWLAKPLSVPKGIAIAAD